MNGRATVRYGVPALSTTNTLRTGIKTAGHAVGISKLGGDAVVHAFRYGAATLTDLATGSQDMRKPYGPVSLLPSPCAFADIGDVNEEEQSP